ELRRNMKLPVAKWVMESEAVLVGPYAISDFGDHVHCSLLTLRRPFSFRRELGHPCCRSTAFRYDPELGPVPNRIPKPGGSRPHTPGAQVRSDGLLDTGGNG